MLLYIIRHGDPIYVTDTLTERGREQAEAVGLRMAKSGIDRIFTSPMGRARETAAPACRLLGLTPTVEEWTHEIGDERLTPFPDGSRQSITNLPSYAFRQNGAIDLPYDEAFSCPGVAESGMEKARDYIEENGKIFLEKLGYREENGIYRILRPNEEKVALFCHTAFARTWLSVLLHIPLHIVWSGISITHTGVTLLEFRNYPSGFTSPRCLFLSDVSHLYAHGPDMKYDNRVQLADDR